MTEMMRMYNPSWMAWVGLLASFIHAFSLPMFGFVLSQYIFVLDLPLNTEADIEFFQEQRNYWAAIFIGIIFGIGFSAGIQKLCFGFGADNLIHTLRVMLFEAILRKNIGWFDDKQKAPGILSNMLTENISAVNGLTT